MKLLDDIDELYSNGRDFIFGFLLGRGIVIVLVLAFVIALFCGWTPIPKRISDQPRSTLTDPFVVRDGVLYTK